MLIKTDISVSESLTAPVGGKRAAGEARARRTRQHRHRRKRGSITSTKIGCVGLGSMSAPIAGRLLDLQTSSQVYGTNRSKEKAAALVARGLRWRDTPREVAETADFVFSMVTDDAALDAITSGPDGILAGLRPGAVYVDMSTVSPDASRELADRVRAAGATLLDAPGSGSVPAAEAGPP